MNKKIRIGNDIDITWSILDADEQPYLVEGRNIAVELDVGKKRVRITEFDLHENQIHFVYYGKDQKYLGSYNIKFIENEGAVDMVTFDTEDAFRLMEHSWLAVDEGEELETIQLEVVTISSELDSKVGPKGDPGSDADVTRANIEAALNSSAGKNLSTEDYTTAEKEKLGEVAPGAQVNVIEGVKVNGTVLKPENKAVNVAVPTQVSQLSEDASHRTVTDTEKTTWNNKVNQSQIADFITRSVNDLANYYLKSDTYTKNEVQALIDAVQQFTYEVVSVLSTASAQTMHKIYLVPSADPQQLNVKDEYITIDNGAEAQTRYTWEQIGSTAIDLSGYVTTAALNEALSNYTTTANLTVLLAGKQDTLQSGVNIKTINSQSVLGPGNISINGVFLATYGTTSFSEIATAFSAGKVVAVFYTDNNLTRLYFAHLAFPVNNPTAIGFLCTVNGHTISRFTVTSNNEWGEPSDDALESLYNKKSTLAGNEASEAYYPNMKALADALSGKQDAIDAQHKLDYSLLDNTPTIPDAVEANPTVPSGTTPTALEGLKIGDGYYDIEGGDPNAVLFTPQTLTDPQKEQARTNIGSENAGNKVDTLSGNEQDTDKYLSTKGAAAALGKWGVISQTQTWSGTGGAPRTYIMSDLVYGLIPQANIDLFESAGATFNATTGYFELNGLTDISYEEMRAIYDSSLPMVERINLQSAFAGRKIRTNLMLYKAAGATRPFGHITMGDIDLRGLCCGSELEVLAYMDSDSLALARATGQNIANMSAAFSSDFGSTSVSFIKKIIGMLTIKSNTSVYRTFYQCYNLQEVKIYKLSVNIDFSQSSQLTPTSVAFMVNNATTATLSITLHATAYAAAIADADVQAALAAHTNVTLASA